MSQSSQKCDVLWLQAMNIIIVGNTWVCHVSVVCFGDNVMCKLNVYASIRERTS